MPGQDDHKKTRRKTGEGITAPDKHGDAGMRASTPTDDGSQEMAEQDANENDDKQSKGLADLMQKGEMQPPHVVASLAWLLRGLSINCDCSLWMSDHAHEVQGDVSGRLCRGFGQV